MHRYFAETIKSFEGFTSKSSWDYAQYSNGFGTKAQYPGEQIDRAEAERRFAAEIEQARHFVEKHAAGWDEGTKAALTSLTFNCGTKWAASGLGEAVRNHDIELVKERFVTYTKAGGQDLPGLVRRRLAEATWIGAEAPAESRAARKEANPTTVIDESVELNSPPPDASKDLLNPTEMAAPGASSRDATETSRGSLPSLLVSMHLLLAIELLGSDIAKRSNRRGENDPQIV